MALRIFTDSAGREWMVWSVTPKCSHVPERRRTPDRRRVVTPNYSPERRKRPDRRLAHPCSERSWLCFETESERKRLTPVPPNWDEYSKQEMEALCSRARPAPKRGR